MAKTHASAEALDIRAATHADIPEIVALVESAYRGDASRAGWTTEADLLDGQRTDAASVQAVLDTPGSTLLVVARGACLLACIQVQDLGEQGYFGMFSVRPELQGQGIGDLLLRAAEAHVRDVFGRRHMEMTVISVRPELIAYYERRGYRRTGETRPFPYGQPQFGLPKRDDLEFAVFRKDL